MDNAHASPKSSVLSTADTSGPTAEKAPVGLVRSPDDATQFLDDLAADISAAQPTIEAFEGHELNREELEYERTLCAALMRQATLEVHPHGLRVFRWLPDGTGLGYTIGAMDRQGRRFEVEFHYETLDRADIAKRSDMGRAILDDVVGALLKARETYLARRDAVPEGIALTTR